MVKKSMGLKRILFMFVIMTLCYMNISQIVIAAENNHIYITVNGQQLKIRLADTVAANELKEMVDKGDFTITTRENGFEQYGSLGKSLTTSDEHINAKTNDVLLYNSEYICIFYGENSYSYTRLGWIEDIEQAELKEILSGNTLNITFSKNSFGTVPNTGIANIKTICIVLIVTGMIAILSWGMLIRKRILRIVVKNENQK